MGGPLRQGEIRWYTFSLPDKRRPVLILTRTSAISYLHSVSVAPISTRIRNIPSEVLLTEADGVQEPCVVNLDNIQTVPQDRLGKLLVRLTSDRLKEVRDAIAFAYGFALIE